METNSKWLILERFENHSQRYVPFILVPWSPGPSVIQNIYLWYTVSSQFLRWRSRRLTVRHQFGPTIFRQKFYGVSLVSLAMRKLYRKALALWVDFL